MEQYKYSVITDKGEKQQGRLWAENKEEARIKLRHSYQYVVALQEEREAHKKKSWKGKDTVEFCYRLSLLVEAGIPIRRVFTLLTKKPHPRIPYQQMSESLNRGHSLSMALRETGFNRIGLTMVEAAERAGTLGETLQIMHAYFQRELAWKKQIQSASTYPAFLLFLMLGFMVVAFVFIIPSFKHVFESMQIPLPLLTKILFAISDGLQAHFLLILVLFMMVIAGSFAWYKRPNHTLWLHKHLWAWCQAHELAMAFMVPRVLKVWSLLLASGVSVTDMLTLSQSLWPNQEARRRQALVGQSIRKGYTLSQALQANQLGNDFLWELIEIGEETGDMTGMLNHAYRYYERLAETYSKQCQKLMEPLLLSLMGIGVGILIVAIMVPMFSAVTSVGNG